MAYTLTPAERRARAQSLRESRENRKLYYNYLNQKAALEREQQNQKIDALQAEQEKANQSFLVRGLSTVGDIVANVLTGAVKGLEGIVDLGIGLVGGIGGIFDGDFQERAKNAIAYDWTGETFGNALQEALKYSYTTNGGIIENVASGIGQMLPSVVATVATAGAGAPAAVAQAASLGTLGVSAAGTSTEEAFREGADYWTGLGYGAASGLVEIGTEKMFGGATKALTGAGILDGITKSVADIGVPRIVKNALEEGVEEIVSELANPALKSIYKGSDALKEYGTGEYWKGVGEAGLVGSLTALAYSGTVGYGLSKVGVGYVGKEADIADSLSEISSLKEKANNLQANGELIGVNEQKIADTTKKNYQNIEKVLQGVSEDKRSKLIEKFNLDKAFNADGSMSGQLSSWFNSVGESAEVADGSQNELASLKKDSYSFNLRGQEQSIISDLDAISENRANAYMQEQQKSGNNISIEQAREAVGKFKVFDGEMSDTARESRNKFNKALNYLNKKSGANLSFVVTESNDSFNGLVIGDRTLYIGEDQFEKGTWAETLVHEYTHLSEDSKEYVKLIDFLSSDDVLVDDGNGGKVELWKKGQESVFDKNYGFDREAIQEIHDKIANEQELTADEQKYFKDFMTEVGAHETQYLLGNEEFIDRIVARDSSFAKTILQKIENLRKAFERVGDRETKRVYKQLHEAEKLYLKAAAKAGDMKLVRYLYSRNPDLKKEIDVSAEIKYNKKTPYVQWKSDALAWSNNAKTKIGDMDSGSDSRYVYFYEAIDPDNDGRATDYRVLAKVSLANETTINEWYAEVKENNEKNHASVYASVDEYERARKEYQSDSSNVLGKTAENGRVSGVYQGESQSERIGNTEKGDENKRVKYSLKDNEYLSAVKNGDLKTAQRFVDEAARKSGYTIKAYHGTLAENFTEFKKSFIGSRFSFDEKGFFFIDRKSIAEDYARSEFDSSKKGHVLETYLKVEKPLLVDSQYAFKEGLGKIFRDDDAIGVWDNYSGFLLEEADKKRADGIIIDDGLSKMIVVFDSNQIKSSEAVTYDNKGNVIPLSERFNNQQNDIRYSLKENSEGKQLSEGQRAFFKDSKVVDEQGRLLVVYHGTKDGNFYTFEYDKNRQTGTDYGKAFYFTTNLKNAKGYAKDNHKDLRINEYNAKRESLTKQILAETNLEKRAELEKQFHNVKVDGKSLLEILYDVDYDTGGEVRRVYLNLVNPLIADGQKKYHYEIYPELFKQARENGNDGIIVKNVDDSSKYGVGLSDVYIAFSPEQIKLVDNITPTSSSDIRYSLKEDSDGRKLTEGQKDYFKNTQIVDDNGKLLVVYHGSKAIFTVFDTEKIGLNGSQEGQGIYFTDNKDFAEGFSDGKGQLLEGYLNIQKPLSDSEVTLTREQVEQVIRKVDPSGDDLLANYSVDSRYYGTDKHKLWYESALNDALDSIMEYCGTDSEIMAELANAGAGSAQVLKVLFDEFGYDGYIVKGKYKGTNVYVPFDSSQFKNATNTTPTTNKDIRFELKDNFSKKYFYELSDGQIKKLIADKTMKKVYSKVESESVINTILQESLGIGEKYGSLVGKSKEKVVDMLWRGLNTAEPGKQMRVALDVAEYIIQNSVLENIYEDSENSIYIDTINTLKPYLHSLDLSALKGEIKYKFDNDNSAYLLWGKRKGERGLTADQVKMELGERGFFIKSDNEADIFFSMDSAYREAVSAMKKKSKELLSSALSGEERKTLKNKIAREVLLAFDKNGKPSKFSKILEQYHKEALTWKGLYYDERTRNIVTNRLLDKVQKIKDWKSGTFLNSSQYNADIFKKSIDKLANIKFRGDLNQSGTRDIVAGLKEWYSQKNPILNDVYDSDIAEMLDDIATGEGKLTTQELRNLSNVVDHFKHFIETYNKVYRNGKYVEAQPIAEKYVSVMKRNKSVTVGWLKKYFEKYLTTFGDPMTVARYFDKYENGFYSDMLATLRESATNAQIDEMNIREPIEDFIKKNKKYFKEAEKKTVKYQGQDIPLLQAMYVYMAMNDADTIPSFAKSGFVFNDGNSDIRIEGFAKNEDIEVAEMQAVAKEIQSSLESQFSAADKEYIEIARKIFNEVCRKKYIDTSNSLKGYANVKEGDYVPIRRANIAKNVDTSTVEYEVKSASNPSFTKDRVKGAKGELRVSGIDTVVDRHIRAIALYANLAPALEEYNKLFNLNTEENNNKPVSVATESRNVWAQGDEYFKKLINDIKGIPAAKGDGIKAMAFIRSGYAKFQLGANPKVWVTQLSSFFASGSILDYTSIVKGIGIKTNDVDTYCELAKLRNNDNTAAMAQGVLEKVDKVGNVLMKPIGTVDRFVIKKLFGACQVQVQKDYGLKIGTEENKVKAGELLKRVILETQQNSMATERSSAMRSGSEFMRTITMFSADSMKVIGRVVDSIGELSALKAKKKVLTDANEIANINKQIEQATKKVAKSAASLITSAVFMALVAQLFRTLYNKDDEDDNVIANMTTDAIGNLFGGLPIFKDIYSRLVEGYEIDGYAYSAINDMLDSAENIFKMCGNIVSGEATSQEVAKNIKNMVYAAGQIFGLPARNVYNIAYGLTKRVSPSTAYRIDTAFYNKKYSADLNKAIARGDDDMIATIVELMTNERVGSIGDSTVSQELNSLVTKGYDVIPRSVGEEITYNGEEISLTSGQRKQFKEVYSVANKAVASLVKLSQYKSASDDVKAKAIKYIYNVYYNLALQDLLGEDLETKTVLFAEAIDVEKLAIIIATANSLTADLDKKGNAISGTRKRKIQAYVNSLKLSAAQKYMVMGYLGFSNLNGESQVKAYINRLNLTKSEKEKLLKYSGYGK